MTDTQAARLGSQGRHGEKPVTLHVPQWHVGVILVGFPLLYVGNSLLPWSCELFVNGQRGHYFAFLASAAVLHWLSVLAVAASVSRAGAGLSEIGFSMTGKQVAVYLAVAAGLGAALIGWRPTIPLSEPAEGWKVIYPVLTIERYFWILICVTAGFCEEFVYRGFAIRALQGRGWPTWQAVLLASVSFVVMHGVMVLSVYPLLFLAGLVFSGIFVLRGRLRTGIYVHTITDLLALTMN